MKANYQVYPGPADGPCAPPAETGTEPVTICELAAPARRAIVRCAAVAAGPAAQRRLVACRVEGDTILESETILLLAFVGRVDAPLAGRAAAYLLQKQLPGGAGPCIPAAPSSPAAA